jgi:hypothetical protein
MPLNEVTAPNPTVGGSTDTWGTENNDLWDQAKATFSNIVDTAENRILGRVSSGTGDFEQLTGAQTNTILPVFGADAGSGGVKGLVPATAAGDAKYPLMGDGTWKRGVGRLAGGLFSMAVLANGGTVTVGASALNIASVSTLTLTGSQWSFVITFDEALPDTDYCVHIEVNFGSFTRTRYFSKSTTQVTIAFETGGSAPVEVSVSIF